MAYRGYLSHGDSAIASTATPPGKFDLTKLLGTAAEATQHLNSGLSTVYSSGSVKALLNAQAINNNVNVMFFTSLMVLIIRKRNKMSVNNTHTNRHYIGPSGLP